ncbi:hypothetical protein [Arthrobacter antibioticus]|uniref:hypothetical protein n=1 Tax=Arthrobacter sp. H35-MC1 TaxID=3046203 RepID=UPI0024B96DB7|nr:hypothetical protein [Arthrobacter sp. H35-MC1]MDJ0318878.1 hypothetical protein [Arthrobacter sp. H35-MC1]
MSNDYAAPESLDEVPKAMDQATPEMVDPFRDGDDDFDYEGHYHRQPVEAAASIARPELADEISFFGVEDLRGAELSPELVTAMGDFRNIAAQYETHRTPELKAQYEQSEEGATTAATEALKRSQQRNNQLTRAADIAADTGASRHVDEDRRTVPATPVFDSALKARQEQISTGVGRGSAVRVKTFLQRIRVSEKKNDLGQDIADSARGLEQARNRGLSRGR